MRGRKKPNRPVRALLLAAVLLLLSFSGCSPINISPESLMNPPLATEDQADIIELLRKDCGGEDPIMRYPRSGEYRSAVILKDFTGGEGGAIALYQTPDGTGTTVAFMTKRSGSWKIVSTFANVASQVDRVCFGDLNGDGIAETVIGWGSLQNQTGSVSVFEYRGSKVTEYQPDANAGEMALVDLDEDGKEELFLVTLASADGGKAVASLYSLRAEGSLSKMASMEMNQSIVRYTSLQLGRIQEDTRALVVDGTCADGTSITQVIGWNQQDQILSALLSDLQVMETSRGSQLSCVAADVNGDGLIEIPTARLLPGVNEEALSCISYLVSWNQLDPEKHALTTVMNTVVNSDSGYLFSYPDMWKGKVTCKKDGDSMVFLLAGEETEIMRISQFSLGRWGTAASEGYEELAEQNSVVYAVKRAPYKGILQMELEDISQAFQLIEVQ